MSVTFARDVIHWIDSLSGPELPFKFRAAGITWCLEQARLLDLKPNPKRVLAGSKTALRP